MATYNFDLLDLADGESGDAAVSVVVGKTKKNEAAAAKVTDAADPAGQPAAAQEKPKYSFYAKQQVDGPLKICQQEREKLKNAIWKLGVEEEKLKEQPGNEARIEELWNQQQKLKLERWKLWEKERMTLGPNRDDFYNKYGIPLPGQEPKRDADPAGSNHNGGNTNVRNNNGDGSSGYSENGGNNVESQTQMGDAGEHYNNGDRQGYPQGQPGTKKVYVRKAKASSDAGTEAEEKPEENVVSATNTEQKEASADNADAVPKSESDKSAGGAAQEGPKKKKTFIPKETFNGSEKRKKKNAKKTSGTEPEEKKQGSEVDGSKPADKQPLEEEKKTLAEYEKMREEKKKTSEASKTEARKVTAEEFKGLQMLEKKKLDDEEPVIKVEKAQPKVKEAGKKEEVQAEGKGAAAKDGKPKKVVVALQNFGFRQPRRHTHVQEDGSSARARFNGSFQGGSRDNSTEPRVNARAAKNEAGGHIGNGAPRGAYNGRGDGAPRGDYSGHRNGHMGNGGYGRGNGGYGYGRGHGVNQGNDGYQQQGQDQGNGGYQPQRQGGNNVVQYQRERAGYGGYCPQRHHPGSNQQGGNSGDLPSFTRAPAPIPDVADMSKFPALPAPASAKSAAPACAPAPVPSQASAPAAAPAPAA